MGEGESRDLLLSPGTHWRIPAAPSSIYLPKSNGRITLLAWSVRRQEENSKQQSAEGLSTASTGLRVWTIEAQSQLEDWPIFLSPATDKHLRRVGFPPPRVK